MMRVWPVKPVNAMTAFPSRVPALLPLDRPREAVFPPDRPGARKVVAALPAVEAAPLLVRARAAEVLAPVQIVAPDSSVL